MEDQAYSKEATIDEFASGNIYEVLTNPIDKLY